MGVEEPLRDLPSPGYTANRGLVHGNQRQPLGWGLTVEPRLVLNLCSFCPGSEVPPIGVKETAVVREVRRLLTLDLDLLGN